MSGFTKQLKSILLVSPPFFKSECTQIAECSRYLSAVSLMNFRKSEPEFISRLLPEQCSSWAVFELKREQLSTSRFLSFSSHNTK